ncbi:MAG TPA: response regulator transcription factor [Gaiellaceae bacterium]|jgi:DNA-binding NarL/FixJ family response regulator
MRRLKLLIADDHALMIEAVALAVKDEPDLEVVGSAESGSQVLPLVERTKPDVVLLDLRMPGMDGLTCIKLLQERHPKVRIAVLSGMDSDEAVHAALALGANAFISKNVEPPDLVEAIRQAANGVLPEPVGRASKRVNAAAESTGLTERELAVLRALGEGRSNKEIAKSLWLAEQTVKFHLTNIYRKLNVSSRTEAVHWAYAHGLIEAPLAGAESNASGGARRRRPASPDRVA